MYHAPNLVQTWFSMYSEIDAIVSRAFCRQRIRHSVSQGSSLPPSEETDDPSELPPCGAQRLAAQRSKIGR